MDVKANAHSEIFDASTFILPEGGFAYIYTFISYIHFSRVRKANSIDAPPSPDNIIEWFAVGSQLWPMHGN